jgi:histone deacetylase HOS3
MTSWCSLGLFCALLLYLAFDWTSCYRSCGFDACEHEYPFMSRHSRKVPASFYYRFTRDACAFADQYAKGRIVSVLEGGYSNRALISGAMAHLSGLTDVSNWPGTVDENWWGMENLVKVSRRSQL